MWGRAKRVAGLAVVLLYCVFFVMIVVSIVVNDLIPWSAPKELRGAKIAYVGDWWSGQRGFRIAANGDVLCHKGFTSYGGRIVSFHGDDFTIFISLFGPERYHVSGPPHREDHTWVMTIDGDRFERSPF